MFLVLFLILALICWADYHLNKANEPKLDHKFQREYYEEKGPQIKRAFSYCTAPIAGGFK